MRPDLFGQVLILVNRDDGGTGRGIGPGDMHRGRTIFPVDGRISRAGVLIHDGFGIVIGIRIGSACVIQVSSQRLILQVEAAQIHPIRRCLLPDEQGITGRGGAVLVVLINRGRDGHGTIRDRGHISTGVNLGDSFVTGGIGNRRV